MAASTPTLFKNATVISFDDSSKSIKILKNASLLVENGRVVQLKEGNLTQLPSGVDELDATNKIISPGFIDTHHHLWQSAFRSIGGDVTLYEYFGRYSQMAAASERFSPEDIYLGQLAGCLELIDCGTTTVLDHASATFSDEHIDAAVNADFDSGLRVIHALALQPGDMFGRSYEQAMQKFQGHLNDPRFSDRSTPVELGVAYDSFTFGPDDRSMEIMDTITKHNNSLHDSGASGAPVSVLTSHMVAGPYGVCNTPTFLNSLPTSVITQPGMKKKMPIVLSHASFLDQKDMAILRGNPHVSISTTPESEAHYGHTSYGADMCQDCASLGVDTHFTFSSYMPYQARLWLQLLRSKWYSQVVVTNGEVPTRNPMSVEAAFLLATQKGGEALGRDDLGVIKVGAQADIVVFGKARPGMWATRDPIAAIILHSCSGDVDGVMVQGRWLKRDGKIGSLLVGGSIGSGKDVAFEDVKKRFEESARKIQDSWATMEKPTFVAGADTALRVARFGDSRVVNVSRRL